MTVERSAPYQPPASTDAAVVLLGHGSRDPEGAAEFLAVADAVRTALPALPVEAGVLEFAGPVAPAIPEAFARCVARGARRILALPVLLHFGGHATADMPFQAAAAQALYPHAEIRLAQPLSGHPALLEILAERCAATPLGADPAATVLLVGRGSTSPRANADLYATARLFQERGPYAAAEVCFVSLAPPCVPAGLRRCVALGARRIVVAPYFVNTGLLVRRIAVQVEAARLFYPQAQVAVAAHFGPDPRLVAATLDRARDAWPELVQGAAGEGFSPEDAASRPDVAGAQPLAPAGGAR
ncbi:MAG TPA: sirohydrochlorin chelatase [Chloroflexota bacterium]|nr:sirohydrochlorin chelatase [Chloroflexota bacterium]